MFKHYLLTFNPDNLEIFRSFTLPSILGQTCQNFTWLIVTDKKLDGFDYPNIRIVSEPTFDEGDYDLITTQIDSDFAIHKKFVEMAQAAYVDDWVPLPIARMFPRGYVFNSGKLFPAVYTHNNCPTLIEKRNDAKTISSISDILLTINIFTQYNIDFRAWVKVVSSESEFDDYSASVWKPGMGSALAPGYAGFQAIVRRVDKDTPVDLTVLKDFNIKEVHYVS